ncbi:MAG: hypothetical protein ACK5RL_19005 [Acidimicrobiales bacterium]
MTPGPPPVRPRVRASDGAEAGDTTLMGLVLITAVLVGVLTLISASEQWQARRVAASAAATLARAAAQGQSDMVRAGGGPELDPAWAQDHVDAVLVAMNETDPGSVVSGRITRIEGPVVETEATVAVRYRFPLPGFPAQVSGTAQAVAVSGADP